MLMRKPGLYLALLYLTFTSLQGSFTALQAQYVIAYQGANYTNAQDPTVAVYDPSTFTNVATLSVPGAFRVLSLADGTKQYYISNTPGAGITAVTNLFTNSYPVGNIQNALGSAALSPDGSRLIVASAPMASGTSSVVYIFDTASDVALTPPQGLTVVSAVSSGIVDVAISYDSQTAYALGNVGQGQSFLSAINLQQNTVTTNLTLDQSGANALALGPNGLLYVSAQNKILEVNPAGLLVTSGGMIDVNALPGRMVFTPDGQYGVAANQTLGTGPAAVLVDLGAHALAGFIPSTGLGGVFDKLMLASSNIIYAWSSAAQALYALQIGSNGGLILNSPNVPGVSFSGVSAAGLSNDLGVPGRNYPQFLFVVSNGALYRIDPATLTMSQQVTLYSSPGDVVFFTPTATGNTPVTVLMYGDMQSIPTGGTTLPLVTRLLDGNGLPISGVPINFAVSGGTGTVNPTVTATGADGYAQATFTAGTTPSDIGAIGVSNDYAAFTVNVGTSSTSAPPPAASGMSVVSGQGQVVLADPASGAAVGTIAPFTVLVTDANGAPLPNAPVTFTWTAGYGLGFGTSGYGVGTGVYSVVVLTDDTGQASTPFLPPPIFIGPNPGFVSDTITASVAGVTSVNFYITGMDELYGNCGNSTCTPVVPMTVNLLQPSSRGGVLTGAAGSTLQNAVEIAVSSLTGVPIPNIGLIVYTGSGPTLSNVSCSNPGGGGVALTNANGIASCNLLLNGVLGTEQLVISAGGLVTFPGQTLTVTAGPPAKINIIGGNNQIGTPGTALPQPFVVQVTDAFNNPLPGVSVNWQVTSGPMTLTAVNSTTDASGHSSAVGLPGGTGGQATITATAGSGSATFTALVSVPAAAMTISSGDGQSALINAPFGAPLVVQVSDVNGNPASFAVVNFSVQSGSAAISSASVVADINGLASITATAGPIFGPVSILATSNGQSVTFSLTIQPIGPTNVIIVNAASFTAQIAPGGLATVEGSGLTPTIQGIVTDTSQMAGYSVTFGSTAAPILALVNQNGVQEINVQVPFEATPGSNNVIIQTPQGSVTLNAVAVSPLAPGIFTNGTVPSGYPQAAALRPDGSIVSATNPAQPGENITFFATGLGLTVPLPATNVPGVPGQVVGNTVYAGVNNSGVAIVSAVYQPGALGVYAVTIQIPLLTMPGSGQPVSLAIVDGTGTSYAAPDAYLPIQ
jgi:uncharacterized protein (TIGR03437 family)